MSGMPWGGSEHLWWRAARLLQDEGHEVAVNYKWWPEPAWHLKEIERNGGEVWYRDQPKSFFEARTEAIRGIFRPVRNGAPESWLRHVQPDAVMITLGYHPDQIFVAKDCQNLGIPYGINVQCASNFFFIHGDRIAEYRDWYKNATRVYFVSPENQHKIETNIAAKLPNAEIVANPFNCAYNADPEWPEVQDGVFKIACVGRIHFQSKGQDLIVDVLSQEKWRDRPIEVTFYGHDQGNKHQLEELIAQYGLQDKMKFGGFVHQVQEIWEQNHALLLPSRYEGAPLVVIEAMICNRMPIVTNIGRNDELIDHGESGFVARAPNIEMLDKVLEEAWDRRTEWKSMGEMAGKHIRERYPQDPIREFADRIVGLKDLALQVQ